MELIKMFGLKSSIGWPKINKKIPHSIFNLIKQINKILLLGIRFHVHKFFNKSLDGQQKVIANDAFVRYKKGLCYLKHVLKSFKSPK